MRRLLKILFALAIIFIVFVIALSILIALVSHRVEQNTVLELEIKGELDEEKPPDVVTQLLTGKRPALSDVLDALEYAKRDRHVSGLIIKIGDLNIGLGKIQEIRDKIKNFRSSGKWATAFMETAGEFYFGHKPYYLATACDAIYLQPSGEVNLIGLLASATFYRGTLDKLNIYPDMDHIGEYKTYMNQFTEKAFTPAHREEVTKMLESFFEQITAGIAEGRKLATAMVKSLVDQGPLTAKEALENKLVDKLLYLDEYYELMKKKNHDTLPKLRLDEYLKKVSSTFTYYGGQKIALIYGIGEINRGESSFNPWSDDQTMGSDTLAKVIKQAREDKSIKAVVFRVDSPGGSAVASDIIWREVVLTKKVKPLVVSMSDVAASGGYWISMSADKIVAQPGTVTASIGILGGKLNLKGFYNNWLGITKDSVQIGKHADLFYEYQNFTEEERQIVKQKFLEHVYRDFLRKVAQGRNMTEKDVDAVGRGRVWTGEQAKKIGLIDELGGIDKAIALAKDKAGISKEAEVEIVKFPKRKSFFEQFLSLDLRALIKIPSEIKQYLRALRSLQRLEREGGLLLMPFEYEIK